MHIARNQRMEKVHIGQYPNEMEQTAYKTLKYSSRKWGFWLLVIEKQSPGSLELPGIWLELLSTSHIFREIKRQCLTKSFSPSPPFSSSPTIPSWSKGVMGRHGTSVCCPEPSSTATLFPNKKERVVETFRAAVYQCNKIWLNTNIHPSPWVPMSAQLLTWPWMAKSAVDLVMGILPGRLPIAKSTADMGTHGQGQSAKKLAWDSNAKNS